MIFDSGNSTLCKMFPESKITKNAKVVREDMNCAVLHTKNGPKTFSLGANPTVYSHIFFNTMHCQYFPGFIFIRRAINTL